MKWAVAVHGGAGRLAVDPTPRIRTLNDALLAGKRSLVSGSALDAVETAVALMEDSGLMNAGKGSCLTVRGRVEMDAGIMDGRNLAFGAVGAVSNVSSPVRAARLVMERTDHILLVAQAAEAVLKKLGCDLKTVPPSDRAKEFYRKLMQDKAWWQKEWPRNISEVNPDWMGTVGAVARDSSGNFAASVSTGGRWGKLEGRLGDSAIPGAGFYARNGIGAVACTGRGEEIMRVMLAKTAADHMKEGLTAKRACRAAITHATEYLGNGVAGLIAIDPKARVGHAFNTEALLWGKISSQDRNPKVQLSRP